MRRRLASVAAILASAALILPATAFSHPLGNFSSNQLVQVAVGEEEAAVTYVLDLAEIPTFQQVQRFDTDGDERIAGAEETALEQDLFADVLPELSLSVDGEPVELGAPTAVELSFPPGQGGLDVTRLEASFLAPLAELPSIIEVENLAFEDRVGWSAIQAIPGSGTAVTSDRQVTDPTDGLRSYPSDLLASPFDQRDATLDVEPGDGTVTGPEGPTVSADSDGDRGGDGFADLLAGGDDEGPLLLLLLAAAFGWGALHALSPGHGKAMVAGYLAGSRGKPRHAVALGLTVTATHTASVFALGLVTLAASQYILPEQIYPWLGVASGAMIVGVGLWVMASRFRRWRAMRAEVIGGEAAQGHWHADEHEHPHPHGHSHGHDHDHSHDHGHSHGHGQHHHHHGDAPIRARELLGLGVSGGLVPCPSALVVLIAAISQHRLGFGILLILAFSFGLAATITAIGLATIWGKRLIAQLRPERRLFGGRITGALPALSAGVIVVAGVLIALRAIPELS